MELPPGDSSSFTREGYGESHLQSLELEHSNYDVKSDYRFESMNALEILRETVVILRYDSSAFMCIAALLICPVSAAFLSSSLVNQAIVKRLSVRILLVAKSSGLPLTPFVKQSCQRFAEMVISSAVCFPFFVTLSLLSKAAIVYTVERRNSRKKFDFSNFSAELRKIWRRLVSTYLWGCVVVVGCLTLFLVLLLAFCSSLYVLGFSPYLVSYGAMVMGIAFSVIFANAIVICNTAVVVSVLEDASGTAALLRSRFLIKGQIQVGLSIFLGSTVAMAFVKGLFEYRVKTISYGDGSSRIWEGPLLVLMYSFVVLIDSMMSPVFYYSCKSSNLESLGSESQSILDSYSAESSGTP